LPGLAFRLSTAGKRSEVQRGATQEAYPAAHDPRKRQESQKETVDTHGRVMPDPDITSTSSNQELHLRHGHNAEVGIIMYARVDGVGAQLDQSGDLAEYAVGLARRRGRPVTDTKNRSQFALRQSRSRAVA
jgi:sRNA-binding protein